MKGISTSCFFALGIFFLNCYAISGINDINSYTNNEMDEDYPRCRVFSKDCGRQPVHHGRLTGHAAPPMGAFPWMAYIQWQNPESNEERIFSGAIVNSRYVLTSAWAVDKIWDRDYQLLVILGARNVTRDEECIPQGKGQANCFHHLLAGVDERIGHPQYDGLYFNDIGLIRLNITLDFSDRSVLIEPICLPLWSDLPMPSNLTDIVGIEAGWDSNLTMTDKTIHANKIAIVDANRCYQDKNEDWNYEKMLCGRLNEVDGSTSRYQREGGILMVPAENGRPPFSVVGVQMDSNSMEGTFYITYVFVPAYQEWIRQTTGPGT